MSSTKVKPEHEFLLKDFYENYDTCLNVLSDLEATENILNTAINSIKEGSDDTKGTSLVDDIDDYYDEISKRIKRIYIDKSELKS